MAFLKVLGGRILALKPSPLLGVSRGRSPGATSAAPSSRGPMGKGPLPSSYCWQNTFSRDGGTEGPVFFLAVEPGLPSAPGASCSQAPQQHGGDSSSPRGWGGASYQLGGVLENVTLGATLPLCSSDVTQSREGPWRHMQWLLTLTGRGSIGRVPRKQKTEGLP